jgi:hypothetical protein
VSNFKWFSGSSIWIIQYHCTTETIFPLHSHCTDWDTYLRGMRFYMPCPYMLAPSWFHVPTSFGIPGMSSSVPASLVTSVRHGCSSTNHTGRGGGQKSQLMLNLLWTGDKKHIQRYDISGLMENVAEKGVYIIMFCYPQLKLKVSLPDTCFVNLHSKTWSQFICGTNIFHYMLNTWTVQFQKPIISQNSQEIQRVMRYVIYPRTAICLCRKH